MAWIKMIEEAEADRTLLEAYETIKGRRGKLSNIMKVHSLNPGAMIAHMDLYLQIMFGNTGLKRELRELIGVVVSATNHCQYCVKHHTEALNFYWKDQDRVEKLLQNFEAVDFPEKTQAALNYAIKLTLYPESIDQDDVLTLQDVGYEDSEILNINLIVSYFNFVNRIASGLGVEVNPDEQTGYQY